MTTLTVIAKFAGWEIVIDTNSVVSIHHGQGQWICSHASAYEAIKSEVKQADVRTELIRQWAAYMRRSRS